MCDYIFLVVVGLARLPGIAAIFLRLYFCFAQRRKSNVYCRATLQSNFTKQLYKAVKATFIDGGIVEMDSIFKFLFFIAMTVVPVTVVMVTQTVQAHRQDDNNTGMGRLVQLYKCPMSHEM